MFYSKVLKKYAPNYGDRTETTSSKGESEFDSFF